MQKKIVAVAIGAVVVFAGLVWLGNEPETPRQEMCANYTDLLSAASANGREEIYKNPVFDDLCKNGGL
ncbi:MAG: hypothetical protein H5U22_06300 [Rhizobium sp.]|nr:hypothetical protein [Rhizobium sp.]